MKKAYSRILYSFFQWQPFMILSKSQDMFICSTLGAVNEDNNLVLHFMDLQKGLFKFLWVLKLAGLKMKSQIK